MKIVIITRNYINRIIDGHIIITNRLIDQVLNRDKYDTVIVSYEEKIFKKKPQSNCWILPILPHSFRYSGVDTYIKSLPYIRKIVDYEKPDIVIVGAVPKEISISLLSRKYKVYPYFYNSPQILRYPPPYLTYKLRPMYWRIFGKVGNIALATSIAMANYLKKYIRYSYWLPPVSEISENTMDRNSLREKYNIDKEKVVIGYLGHIDPYRGIGFLKSIAKPLKKQDILLAIYPAPSAYTNEHKRYYKMLVSSGVKIINVKNVLEAYILSDIILLPFTQYYGYTAPPLTILEALYYNGIVITTPTHLIDELFELGFKLFILEKYNPDNIVFEILNIVNMSTREKEAIIGRNMSLAKKYYSSDAVRGRISKILGSGS